VEGTSELGGCPRCREPLAEPRGISRIDKPFEPCTSCGAFVARPGANEWDLLPLGLKTRHVAQSALLALSLGIVPALVHLAATLTQGAAWEAKQALLWLAGGCVVAGCYAGSRLGSRIQRSRRRMGDPMYRARLVKYEIEAASRR
jgi:hypothetical protein